MKPGFRLLESALQNRPNQLAVPALLVRLDPWHKVFLRNLRDLVWLRRDAPLILSCPPGLFWKDVFVKSRLPWGRFVESAVFHSAAIAMLWSSAQLWPQRPHLAAPLPFQSSQVISYEVSEYLPPLNTGNSPAAMLQLGDPVYAPQPIISVPPQSENQRQTIVTPPELKLNRDEQLPNIVAWEHRAPMISPAATATRISELRLPNSSPLVITPPPDVRRNRMNATPVLPSSIVVPAPEVAAVKTRREAASAQLAVVAPPPSGVEMADLHHQSDINIPYPQAVAPAPQLPIDEPHAVSSVARTTLGNSTVVPPPPSVGVVSGTSAPDGRLIALSIHPAPPAGPLEIPRGNRRGVFAATSQGKSGASGRPEIGPSVSPAEATVVGPESRRTLNGVPPGLFVGRGPQGQINSQTEDSAGNDPQRTVTDPPWIARASPERAIASEISPEQQSEAERETFGIRKSYSMTLNVPNLNSAGGSLVMHFSELKEGEKQGDLFAPVATRVVAPGYPLELMRQNVQGTVELTAVIRSDGSVSDVRVLNSADDRLEEYARSALLRWQFLPAIRNGKPVPLQAVVQMPFKPRNMRF